MRVRFLALPGFLYFPAGQSSGCLQIADCFAIQALAGHADAPDEFTIRQTQEQVFCHTTVQRRPDICLCPHNIRNSFPIQPFLSSPLVFVCSQAPFGASIGIYFQKLSKNSQESKTPALCSSRAACKSCKKKMRADEDVEA